MTHETLIGKMRRQRQVRADLAEGKSITLLRPPEAEFPSLARGVTLDHVRRYAVGWDGFTEADLLTSGGSDPVEFHVELVAELLNDRADWLSKVSNRLIEACNQRYEERKAALGN